MHSMIRTRWAAVGATVAITLGAGAVTMAQAGIGTGPKPVYIALDAPCRVVDTRPATTVGPKNTPIAAGEPNAYDIQITGANGNCTDSLAVPADAVAVALNVTAIAPQAPTTGRSFFTVYPADATRPTTSNLNFLTGQPPVPNKVDVGLSDTGKIKIYNNEGTAHAAVDIFGYYIDHTHDDRYYTKPEIDSKIPIVPPGPGVAATFNLRTTTLNNATVRRVGSTSIRVPADGYVIVNASGVFTTSEASAFAWCQLTKGSTRGTINVFGPGREPYTRLIGSGGFGIETVFQVSAADNPLLSSVGQAIGLDCVRGGILGSTTIDDVYISATYVPTSYAPTGAILP